mmetsp:Transcript_42547/g.84210  ORF Transcript_42547/g.84210 Transcript_42547/m.84210 type:complete len:223 (-) Transcript_42547:2371-3039(-)
MPLQPPARPQWNAPDSGQRHPKCLMPPLGPTYRHVVTPPGLLPWRAFLPTHADHKQGAPLPSLAVLTFPLPHRLYFGREQALPPHVSEPHQTRSSLHWQGELWQAAEVQQPLRAHRLIPGRFATPPSTAPWISCVHLVLSGFVKESALQPFRRTCPSIRGRARELVAPSQTPSETPHPAGAPVKTLAAPMPLPARLQAHDRSSQPRLLLEAPAGAWREHEAI